MSPSLSGWMEIVFDLAYLVIIYALVVLMSARLSKTGDPRHVLRRFRDGFLLLALGDTGHVGFRVIALLQGGLEAKAAIGRFSFPLVGVGALATAITITFLYLLLLDVWRVHFQEQRPWIFWPLVAVGVVRLLLLLPPENRWADVMPPWDWSVLRNLPLLVLGLSVAALFIADGRRRGEKTFVQLGWLIVLSYACYAPVILFVQAVPLIGLLMVPKTVVYLVMAWLVYARLFKPTEHHDHPAALAT